MLIYDPDLPLVPLRELSSIHLAVVELRSTGPASIYEVVERTGPELQRLKPRLAVLRSIKLGPVVDSA